MTGFRTALRRITGWEYLRSRRDRIGTRTIVLLGDSITEGGDWARLLGEHEIANYGYSGYTTQELLPVARQIAASEPAAVFILTGTNDIRDGHPPEWTARALAHILDALEVDSAPRIVVQSIFPRSDEVMAVRRANTAIEAVLRRRGVEYLDLHDELSDGRGGLRRNETTDGIHLDLRGYERWARRLDSAIRQDQR